MNIKYETLCEIGSKRNSNQDRITAHSNDKISIFAVADGMGGHSKGEFASETVIIYLDTLWNEFSIFSRDFQTAVDMVITALNNANEEIFRYAQSENIICGSTASVLLIYNDLYAVINVGDSPVYHSDRKKAVHDSTEHSYDQIILKSTLISPNELEPNRNGRLVQAVGVRRNIIPSVKTGALKGKETFLICSDGISRYFTDKKIFGYLRRTTAEKIDLSELLNILKNTVYSMGAEDNLSAIVITINNHSDSVGKLNKFKSIFIATTIFTVLFIWVIINIMILK